MVRDERSRIRQGCQDGCYKGQHLWTSQSAVALSQSSYDRYKLQENANRTTDRNRRGTARDKLWWGTEKQGMEHQGEKNGTAATGTECACCWKQYNNNNDSFFRFLKVAAAEERGDWLHQLECFGQEGSERSLRAGRLLQLLQKAAAMPLVILSDLTVQAARRVIRWHRVFNTSKCHCSNAI